MPEEDRKPSKIPGYKGSLSDNLVMHRETYASWDEWFRDTEQMYAQLRMSPHGAQPDKDTMLRLGPMPTPPWDG